jgi:hypothetical protein
MSVYHCRVNYPPIVVELDIEASSVPEAMELASAGVIGTLRKMYFEHMALGHTVVEVVVDPPLCALAPLQSVVQSPKPSGHL